MNKPSSTISAATIAGMGASLVWELVGTFTAVNPTPGLVAGSAVFVGSLVGYMKKENVIK